MFELKQPRIRKLSELREVVYDKAWLGNSNENMELYYMYRDLSLSKKDREMILDANLRYDITIIPPGMLGIEYVKTLGHYHPDAKPGITYPELYEVLEGEAVYLFQKSGKSYDEIEEAIAVKAQRGDKVLIPPNYGHVAINPAKKSLKMANIVERNFTSIYKPYIEKEGAAYFLTEKGCIKNINYKKLPELRFFNAKNKNITNKLKQFGIKKEKEIYSLIKEKKPLEFLTAPEKFDFSRIYQD